MQLMINVNDSSRKELEATLKFGPPPDFNNVIDAVTWADQNLPINTYIEVWSPPSRVWLSGYVRSRGSKLLHGIHATKVTNRPHLFDLRSGK